MYIYTYIYIYIYIYICVYGQGVNLATEQVMARG